MASNQNEIFFDLLNHSLEENPDENWAFKTSYIYTIGLDQELAKTAVIEPDLIPDIIEYINEAKPYHTKFSGLLEVKTTSGDVSRVSPADTNKWFGKLRYDRLSCYPDVAGYDEDEYDTGDYDFPEITQEDLERNAANRVLFYHNFNTQGTTINFKEKLGCEFRGLIVSGGDFNIDNLIGYDANFFESLGYDVPGYTVKFISDGSQVEYDFTTPFDTHRIWVRINGTDIDEFSYDFDAGKITLDSAPDLDDIIEISSIDFDYLYDRILATNMNWDDSEKSLILDGGSFIQPYVGGNSEENVTTFPKDYISIRVKTTSVSVTAEDGYDTAPYDTVEYDSQETDTFLLTGGAPPYYYEFDTVSNLDSGIFYLENIPLSNDSIIVLVDGAKQFEGTDYIVDWSDIPDDDAVLYPRIEFLDPGSYSSDDRIDIIYSGPGGSPVENIITLFEHNVNSITLDFTPPGSDQMIVTVDGQFANYNIVGNELQNISPSPSNSTVIITTFKDTEFSRTRKQIVDTASSSIFIPSGPVEPAHSQTLVFGTNDGLLRRTLFNKVYVSDGSTGPYDTHAPSDGNVEKVFVDGEEVTFTQAAQEVTLDTAPSLNSVITILSSSTSYPNDFDLEYDGSAISGLSDEVEIYTVRRNTNSGVRVEQMFGNSDAEYPLSQAPELDIHVWVDGELQFRNINYQLVDNMIEFIDDEDHSTSVLTFMYNTLTFAAPAVEFRLCGCGFNVWNLFRIADRHTTVLESPIDIETGKNAADYIEVKDANVLQQPDPPETLNRRPGVAFINQERFEFWNVDTSVTPHRLSNLRRGTRGSITGIFHPAGSRVIDTGMRQASPEAISNQVNRTVINHVVREWDQNTVNVPTGDMNLIKVWERRNFELLDDVDENTTQFRISNAYSLRLPSRVELVAESINPAFDFSDVVTFTFSNGVSTSVSTGSNKTTFRNNINGSGTLSALGFSAEFDDIGRLTFISIPGLSFTLTEHTGTPVDTLFSVSEISSEEPRFNGLIWLNNEAMEFEWIDLSDPSEKVIHNLIRKNPVSHEQGTIHPGTVFVERIQGTEYSINTNDRKVIFNSSHLPELGSIVRVQAGTRRSRFVNLNNIQRSDTSFARFLRKGQVAP